MPNNLHTLTQLHSPEQLCQAMYEGALLLTLSNRQRQWCIQLYAEQAGQQVVAQPQVQRLQEWVASHSNLLPLDSCSEAWLWHSSFRADFFAQDEPPLAGQMPSLAQASAFARMCDEWQVQTQDSWWNQAADAYRKWHLAFCINAATAHCATPGMQLAELLQRPSHKWQASRIVLVGVLFANPLIDALIAAWQAAAVRVETWQPQPGQQSYKLVRSQPHHAIDRVVADAHALAEQGKRVLVVAPDLTSNWWQVFGAFWRVFSPHISLHACLLDQTRRFNLSGGVVLSSLPSLALAGQLLALEGNTRLHKLLPLLHNPVLDWGGDQPTLEKLWKEQYHTSLTGATRLGQGYAEFPDWCTRALAALESLPGRALPGDWARAFDACLHTLGWLTSPSSDSFDYQVYQHWRKALQTLAELDRFNQACNRSQALAMLRHWLDTSLYQPQLAHARVQVLSTFEAVGMRFDETLVLGLDAKSMHTIGQQQLPLPRDVQRKYNLPGSSPQRMAEDAARLWDCLLRSAPRVCLYHAQLDGGAEALINPCVLARPEIVDPPARTPDRPACTSQSSERAKPVPKSTLGTSQISAWMECGWKGWWAISGMAVERFGPTRYPGALVQGQVLHYALAWLAGEGGFASVKQSCITEAIATAIDRHKRQLRPLGSKALEAMAAFWVNVLAAWLRNCNAGSPEQTETSYSLQLGGLQLGVRVDRIDRLADKSVIILDYKSGTVPPITLSAGRADNTQLLVYATALQLAGEQVAGLGYGVLLPVKNARLVCKGNQAAGTYLRKGNRPSDDANNWDNQLDKALDFLHSRCSEYTTGRVSLDPINAKVCTRCALGTSCRIARQRLAIAGEDA